MKFSLSFGYCNYYSFYFLCFRFFSNLFAQKKKAMNNFLNNNSKNNNIERELTLELYKSIRILFGGCARCRLIYFQNFFKLKIYKVAPRISERVLSRSLPCFHSIRLLLSLSLFMTYLEIFSKSCKT